MRWLIFLSRYNMIIKYYFKSENSCADVLFQRDQNNPDKKDKWMFHQFFQLLKLTSANLSGNEENRIKAILTMIVIIASTVTMPISTNEYNRIKQLWIFSAHDDKDYNKAWQAIKKEIRQFPSKLNLKALIMECQANNNSTLWFKNWHWAPKSESLQTALIYDVHTFIQTDHAGQHNTYSILIYNFFWLEMFNNVY